METSYLWRITIPSTGEILETTSSCKSPNETVIAAKQYAHKNIDQDTPISITVLDDQKQTVQTLDTTTTAKVIMSLNKAYTAARLTRDRIELQKMVKQGEDIAWFGDARYTPVPGGVVIKANDGSILGAIGISGRPVMAPMGDEELARIGAKVVQA